MDKRIPETILPEGYNGKIILALISGAGMEERIVLRSGDDWHREILRNTKAEIKRYGIADAQVDELGGAWINFDENGKIVIFGSSDDFGACDKTVAAEFVRRLYPDRTVTVAD
ncbi:MAG: hypothetical protein HOK25_08115 [Rhodospirillaceae bacterium]|jgi:hypothetical protein|nr:hypothetical protein [Rhodospirillaceae bacterium]MBT7247594.1 hypothetical protein [Rhodospirillaceae bacterium]MBT7509523.1 hypothetical protein [Rhodospirillaceae bacterium]